MTATRPYQPFFRFAVSSLLDSTMVPEKIFLSISVDDSAANALGMFTLVENGVPFFNSSRLQILQYDVDQGPMMKFLPAVSTSTYLMSKT